MKERWIGNHKDVRNTKSHELVNPFGHLTFFFPLPLCFLCLSISLLQSIFREEEDDDEQEVLRVGTTPEISLCVMKEEKSRKTMMKERLKQQKEMTPRRRLVWMTMLCCCLSPLDLQKRNDTSLWVCVLDVNTPILLFSISCFVTGITSLFISLFTLLWIMGLLPLRFLSPLKNALSSLSAIEECQHFFVITATSLASIWYHMW